MCSELFRIPYEWGGVPIFGFGVLLAIWAVVGGGLLVSLVRQQGWNAETRSFLPVLLMLGAAIVLLPRFLPGGFPVRGYGVMLLVGISTSVWMCIYRGRQVGLDPELIISGAVWMILCGLVGARLFYVIEYWGDRFGRGNLQQTIVEVLNFPEGGLVIYGGLFGGLLGLWIFARRHKLPLLALADIGAPAMVAGLAFGRIGCFLNGCCYGGETEHPWAVTFPRYASRYEDEKSPALRRYSPPYSDQASSGEFYGMRLEAGKGQPVVVAHVDAGSPAAAAGLKAGDAIVAIDGVPLNSLAAAESRVFTGTMAGQSLALTLHDGRDVTLPPIELPARSRPVHPAQLYSAVDAGLLAWLLWSFYPFRRRDGEVIALLLTIHPISRFLLEVIRVDEPAVFGTGLSISQNISVGLLVCAAALWWYLRRQPRGTVWARAA